MTRHRRRGPPTSRVLRVKRDVLRRSAIGVMATNRSVSASGVGSNTAYGVDGAFLLSQALTIGTYWARTATTGRSGNDQSYQARADYSVDRYGAVAEFLSVGRNFDPQVGFRRRSDINRSFGQLRFSPRPSRIPSVRKFTVTTGGEYVANGAGQTDTRAWTGRFGTEFENSDALSLEVTHEHQVLRVPFTPAGSPAAIPPGAYTFPNVSASYAFGAQRRAAGAITLEGGRYYDGDIRSVTIGPGGMSPARIAVLQRLAVEPTLSVSRIERAAGSYTVRLARTRVDYAFTPLMFVSALVQYSSTDRAFSTNLRYRWEFAPGSELFLVYTDERDMTEDRFVTPTTVRGLKNRVLVFKVNRLFRY